MSDQLTHLWSAASDFLDPAGKVSLLHLEIMALLSLFDAFRNPPERIEEYQV
jgi:hypothetical protein